jgi:ADP-heptose:LPS heptosyltransferase
MVQMIDSLSRRGFSSRQAIRSGVLIHPGSGAERKNWPRENFMELARRLKSAGREVRVVLGEVELEKWGRAACDEFASVAQIVQPQSLTELSDAIAQAALVVCNDSGPAHLAAATGAPTIALFGPTSHPVRWQPLGPGVKLIIGETMAAIGFDQVEQAAREALDKK